MQKTIEGGAKDNRRGGKRQMVLLIERFFFLLVFFIKTTVLFELPWPLNPVFIVEAEESKSRAAVVIVHAKVGGKAKNSKMKKGMKKTEG